MPKDPVDVVLGASRSVVPIGERAHLEATQVTATGACAGKDDCVRVPMNEVNELVALVRALGPFRSTRDAASPHYGDRWLTVRWKGGECRLHDGQGMQVDRSDAPKLSAAWSAVVDVAARYRAR